MKIKFWALSWLKKKILNEKVDPDVLMNSIGSFSNKKPNDVMQKKKLSKKQYDCRYNFLSEAYNILANERNLIFFKKNKIKKIGPIPDWYIENKSIKEVPNYVYGKDKLPSSLKKIADKLFK